MSTDTEGAASVESIAEFKGEDGAVKRWLTELRIASAEEEGWREDAREAVSRFRGRSKIGSRKQAQRTTDDFNILYSNTEIMAGALGAEAPRPIVKRRYSVEDPQGALMAQLIERALSHQIDEMELFETEVPELVEDYLLAGRTVPRIRYLPVTAPQLDDDDTPRKNEAGEPLLELLSQQTAIEGVQWDDFRRGPGRRWREVPWVAFRHRITKDDAKEQFPDKADWIDDAAFDWEPSLGAEATKDEDREIPDMLKRITVWEIWCKRSRKVHWVCTTISQGPLDTAEPDVHFRNFFPVPRPALAVKDPDTLVPTTLFSQYKAQADHLRALQQRIRRLTASLKAVGIYDSTIEEVKKLRDLGDGDMIPARATGTLAERGGLASAVWMYPTQEMASVLLNLLQMRQQVIQEIYELTGISDILRGASDPRETLGAQQLKAATGGQRFGRHVKEMQRLIRESLRMCAEVISEKFDPGILARMTESDAAEVAAIENMLRDDVTRSFKIDIETEASSAEQMSEDKAAISELVGAIVELITNLGPAVQQGSLPKGFVTKIIKAATHKFRLGRDIDDAMDELEAHLEHSMQQSAGVPEEQAQQMVEKALEQGRQEGADQTKLQIAQMEQQHAQSLAQAKGALETQLAQLKAEADSAAKVSEQEARMVLERERQDFEREKHDDEMALKRRELDLKDEDLDIRRAELRARRAGAAEAAQPPQVPTNET